MAQVTMKKGKLVMGVMAAKLSVMAGAVDLLCRRFGPVDFLSEPYTFDQTKYYEPEMGPGLKKRLVCFRDLVFPDRLVSIKRITGSLEKDLAEKGRRIVNLDPGFLSPDSLVLTSVKDAPHRIFVQPGIHAELTLVFECGEYVCLPWTYPDYALPKTRGFLGRVRKRLLWQLKEQNF
ncbi:GTP-binding protein [Dethiosulfatarculus sandiegensis]|uniref:GTP-binding protein n=2 Tax=Dethiosulfatarculus sandiegensis TaxID=1429043 RepID=A0A0D2GD46_9BACT|nr:GTP-binding protein [Dethiosulfatarculus sandiegensis]